MMTKRLIIIAISVLSLFSFTTCKKWKCIKGNGVLVSENRNISNFEGVVSMGDYDVQIIKDSVFGVYLEGDQNILPYVETYIDARTKNLVIEKGTDKCIRLDEPVYLEIHMPDVYTIELAGSGIMWCNTIKEDRLNVVLSGSGEMDIYDINTRNIRAELSGSGQIHLYGKNDHGEFLMPGSGRIESDELVQESCNVHLEGSGDVLVQVKDHLYANISGSGNVVYYYVPPYKLVYDISGSGKVIGSGID